MTSHGRGVGRASPPTPALTRVKLMRAQLSGARTTFGVLSIAVAGGGRTYNRRAAARVLGNDIKGCIMAV